jgi:aspartate aminotransferase
LTGPQDAVKEMLAEFRVRRDQIVEGLNQLPGVECITPQGAFYAFPRITETGYSADELADMLLDESGVACLSGTAFGRYGEGHLRFSYANSRENIGRALDRMNELLSRAVE